MLQHLVTFTWPTGTRGKRKGQNLSPLNHSGYMGVVRSGKKLPGRRRRLLKTQAPTVTISWQNLTCAQTRKNKFGRMASCSKDPNLRISFGDHKKTRKWFTTLRRQTAFVLFTTATCTESKQQLAWLEVKNSTINATAYALLRASPLLDFAPWPTDPTASSVQNEANPRTCLPPALSASAAKIPGK